MAKTSDQHLYLLIQLKFQLNKNEALKLVEYCNSDNISHMNLKELICSHDDRSQIKILQSVSNDKYLSYKLLQNLNTNHLTDKDVHSLVDLFYNDVEHMKIIYDMTYYKTFLQEIDIKENSDEHFVDYSIKCKLYNICNNFCSLYNTSRLPKEYGTFDQYRGKGFNFLMNNMNNDEINELATCDSGAQALKILTLLSQKCDKENIREYLSESNMRKLIKSIPSQLSEVEFNDVYTMKICFLRHILADENLTSHDIDTITSNPEQYQNLINYAFNQSYIYRDKMMQLKVEGDCVLKASQLAQIPLSQQSLEIKLQEEAINIGKTINKTIAQNIPQNQAQASNLRSEIKKNEIPSQVGVNCNGNA
jgi:hypothetical protein